MGHMAELSRDEIAAMRRSYGEVGIVSLPEDPIAALRLWLADAAANPLIVEPNAMVLSTVDSNQPSSRTVLLKGLDDGLTFFTNYNSRKAHEIEKNEAVCLLFPWYPMERQVIVLGVAEKVSEEESDQYFASRPWGSQIGAIASDQSQLLDEREELERRWNQAAAKYPEGTTVPRPSHWGGYRVTPHSMEFWQGRYSRLHDRVRFERNGSNWQSHRLFP